MTEGMATATLSSAAEAADAVAIPIRRRDGELRAYAYVDVEDAHLAEKSWHLDKDGYAIRTEYAGRKRTQLLAREVLGLAPGDKREADHINRDKLDNRRSNLRIVTAGQNNQNLGEGWGASRHRGVSYSPSTHNRKWWIAQVIVNRKRHWLGRYETETEAARVASAFRAEHMPYSEDARKETQ